MKRILLDLDGVLANWFAGAAACFGMTEDEALAKLPAGGGATHIAFGMWTEDEMWRAIDRDGSDFWRGLPLYPHAMELVEECRRLSDGNVAIATKPSRDAGSAEGKVLWMQRHFGEKFRDYVISPRKHWLAMPGVLLVDDWEKNTEAFEEHGGSAVLFPRRWNRRHADHGRALEVAVTEARIWAEAVAE